MELFVRIVRVLNSLLGCVALLAMVAGAMLFLYGKVVKK